MTEQQQLIPAPLVTRLRRAERVAVLTGAGVSAESGIPTFRDRDTGLWARFNPDEVATPEAFRRNPARVWRWYLERRQKMAQARPNPAHYALAQVEQRIPHFTLITQNIDGLHRRAGSRNVVELHGNIERVRCVEEGTRFDSWEETGEVPPRCPNCGAYLRPDVVWFGELLPREAFNAALATAASAEIFFSVGTSATVEPAASLPLEALRSGAVVVEVNPGHTPLTPLATHVLRDPAGKVLPALVRTVWPEAGQ